RSTLGALCAKTHRHPETHSALAGASPPFKFAPGLPHNGNAPKCSRARVEEMLLLEMLDFGPRVLTKNEGGCLEIADFCIDRGALRRALSYGTGATRDAKLFRGARQRIQV